MERCCQVLRIGLGMQVCGNMCACALPLITHCWTMTIIMSVKCAPSNIKNEYDKFTTRLNIM